ncbi:MAG: TFIIB-type zinc ribbon-containing protein [Candidatus Bathyarchaeota archaeon]
MKCTNCGSDNLVMDYSSGEEICGRCGLVLQNNILNLGPEWRAFNSQEREKKGPEPG